MDGLVDSRYSLWQDRLRGRETRGDSGRRLQGDQGQTIQSLPDHSLPLQSLLIGPLFFFFPNNVVC